MKFRGRSSESQGDSGEGGKPGGFNLSWALSAGVLALVALMGLGLLAGRLLAGGSDETPAEPSAESSSPGQAKSSSRESAATSSPTPAEPSAADGKVSPCPGQKPPKKGASSRLEEAPETEWEPFGGGVLSAPKTSAGPSQRNETGRRCFERTPLGAVTAAATVLTASAGKREVARFAITHQVTEGSDRTEALRRVNTPDGIPPESEMKQQISGFKMVSFSADQAVVSIAVSFPSGGLAKVNCAMVWSGGDWKLRGSGQPKPTPAESLPASYVPWGETS